MKKILKAGAIALFSIMIFTSPLHAQPMTPPNGSHNNGGNELGGSAPVGNGVVYLVTFALMYGYRKLKNHSQYISDKRVQ